MKLTKQQVEFCAKLGINKGYEGDDQEPQLSHLVWPGYGNGALCESPLLWFHGDDINDQTEITCPLCPSIVQEIALSDPRVLGILGTLAFVGELQRKVVFAADELIWGVDNPEKALTVPNFTPQQDLREALAEEQTLRPWHFPSTPRITLGEPND